MSSIVMPTQEQLSNLVEPYLSKQSQGLAFVIGYASPQFSPAGNLYFAGNATNQFGSPLSINGDTPFMLASISKTFTATLYALLIRSISASQTVGDYIVPNGPLQISEALAGISLDNLMNYTSGLPQDNETDANSTPPYPPAPYSVAGMLSYLNADPPTLQPPGTVYTYSNLGFALMGAILSGSPPGVNGFTDLVRDCLLDPLGMGSMYFNRLPIKNLPLGYDYDYKSTPIYWPTSPGWTLFPSYFGAGGLVASPNDMLQWLMFNMGILQSPALTPLLPVLQTPSTSVEAWGTTQLGLGWFITPASGASPGSIWKDGGLNGANTYIAFLPSPEPGSTASQAGAFVLTNSDGITGNQKNDGAGIVAVIANDLLAIMQGQTPPTDKSRYPRSIAPSRDRQPRRL